MALTITRSRQIKDEWTRAVFQNPLIQAISPIVLYHDITEDAHLETSSIRYNQETNFWMFSCSRAPYAMSIGYAYRVNYSARVVYTKKADPRGNAWFECIDAIETLQEVIITELGSQWGGLVGGSSLPQTPPEPTITNIVDEPVFTIQYNVQGEICQA